MDVIKGTMGDVVVAGEPFLRFVPADGLASRESRLPFRTIYEDVPCQRRGVLEDCQTKIIQTQRKAGGLRLRLDVGGKFRIDVELIGLQDGFSLSVFPETLVETYPNLFRVLELDLLPDFLGARQGDGGYYLLPNFCGATMGFDKPGTWEHRDMVYGEQCHHEHYVAMPLCGMRDPDANSWLCLIANGQFDARVVARGGEGQCRLAPSCVVRHAKEAQPVKEVFEAQYLCLPRDADYNAMARRYRQHLIEVRGMRPLAERLPDNPVLAYAASSYHCKIFMGLKTGMLHDGREEMTVCTTFADTAAMARALRQSGVERCVFFLVGWNPDGHDGKWPTRFPVEERLGGEAGFRALKATMDELGYQLSVHDNHADAYKLSEDFPHLDLLTDRSGEPVGGSHWGGGASYRICPATMPRPGSLLDLERVKRLGVNGIYYLDNMPSPIFTCHHPKHPANRRDYAMGFRRLGQCAADLFGCCAAEGYNDYILETVDMPWKVHAPFRELCHFLPALPWLDAMVPFFQVAYHGLKLYHLEYAYRYPELGWSGAGGSALEVALGAMPMNEVQARGDAFHIPRFDDWREVMAAGYREVSKARAGLHERFIERIDMDRGRIETEYSGGVRLVCDLKTGEINKSA